MMKALSRHKCKPSILDAEHAKSFKDDNDVVVVAYQEDTTIFIAVADQIDDYQEKVIY